MRTVYYPSGGTCNCHYLLEDAEGAGPKAESDPELKLISGIRRKGLII